MSTPTTEKALALASELKDISQKHSFLIYKHEVKRAAQTIETLCGRVAELEAGDMVRQRLLDLVRQQRAELHEAGLISDEEYTQLGSIGALARLETYDEMRQRIQELEKDLLQINPERLKESRDDAQAACETLCKRNSELEADSQLLDRVLNDPQYQGGVQFWIQKHDALLLRIQSLEAQAAAMRGALEKCLPCAQFLVARNPQFEEPREAFVAATAALATDAGKDLLADKARIDWLIAHDGHIQKGKSVYLVDWMADGSLKWQKPDGGHPNPRDAIDEAMKGTP